MFSLAGKNAFITGGASGIGLAVAERFVKAGAKVVIADLSDGTGVAADIGANYLELNVTDEMQMCSALEEAVALNGKLDIVVHNAGITGKDNYLSIADGTADHLRQVFEVNTFGVFHGLKHAPAQMNDAGSMIITSSLSAVMGVPGNAQYTATKAAISQLGRISALELGERGIRVNSVLPSYIRTDMGASSLGVHVASRVTALGRMGELDELVGVYHFLAADESRYITGQMLNVDGGWSAGLSNKQMDQFRQESGWDGE